MTDVAQNRSQAYALDEVTAGILKRGVAALIDMAIFYPVAMAIYIPTVSSSLGEGIQDFTLYGPNWWRIALHFLLLFSYSLVTLGRYGYTVGMLALRLRVTNLDFSRISFRRATLRSFIYLLPGLLMYFLMMNAVAFVLIQAAYTMGLLWIMVDRAHQGFHDKLAKTLVIHKSFYQQRQPEANP